MQAGDSPPVEFHLDLVHPVLTGEASPKGIARAQRLLLNEWRKMNTIHNAKFSLGRVVATPGALEALKDAEAEAMTYLQRHAVGDWGDLSKEDLEENELSLAQGFRLLSAYHLPDLVKIWIITEADRSVTTILLPDEY